MSEDRRTYKIPVNLKTGGRTLNGLIKTQNLIEAVIVFILGLFILSILKVFISSAVVLLVLFLIFSVAPAGIALIGIKGLTLSQKCLELFLYKKNAKNYSMKKPINLNLEAELKGVKEKEQKRKQERQAKREERRGKKQAAEEEKRARAIKKKEEEREKEKAIKDEMRKHFGQAD